MRAEDFLSALYNTNKFANFNFAFNTATRARHPPPPTETLDVAATDRGVSLDHMAT